MKTGDIERLLNQLPEHIEIFNGSIDAEFEEDKYNYYLFVLHKDEDDNSKYELSYFDYLWDKELIAFEGTLTEATKKMYEWCKENGYI